jgi:hypothetical protein
LEPVLTGSKDGAVKLELTPQQLQYHLEEYKALRAEVLAHEKSSVDVYLYAVVASGGIAAWLLTHRTELLLYGVYAVKGAAVIPFFVAVMAFSWSRVFNSIIGNVARYGREVEQRLAAPGLGWETFLSAGADIGAHAIPRRQRLRWLALLAANALLVIVA